METNNFRSRSENKFVGNTIYLNLLFLITHIIDTRKLSCSAIFLDLTKIVCEVAATDKTANMQLSIFVERREGTREPLPTSKARALDYPQKNVVGVTLYARWKQHISNSYLANNVSGVQYCIDGAEKWRNIG